MSFDLFPSASLAENYPILSGVLSSDPNRGIAFSYRSDHSAPVGHGQRLALKHYYVSEYTKKIIENNLRWAAGEVQELKFQFAYLMLPTPCNHRCPGCFMGQDKRKLPPHLDGSYFDDEELDDILSFLTEHGGKAAVYGGGGELFAWRGAFDFLERIASHGLSPVIFTNGSLLSREDVAHLNQLNAILIVSLRDTVEAYHDSLVRRRSFRSALAAVEYALAARMHLDSRLGVEIPVTNDNEGRVLRDLLPALRLLGIAPLIEEYIQTTTSPLEKSRCHNFGQARSFFDAARASDAAMGIRWSPELGTRIIGQPQCRRSLYSFAVFPSRDVLDCPSHSVCYGNLCSKSLHSILYSEAFKKHIQQFELCPCSVFYTSSESEVPKRLPKHLEDLR